MGKILRIVATVIGLLICIAGSGQVWLVSQTIPSHGLHVASGDGDSSVLSVDTTVVTMAVYDSGAIKSIVIDTISIYIRDDDAGIGMQYWADYSPGYTSRTPVDKEYDDTHLGGQDLNSTVYSPGDEEHGNLIMWDTNCDCWIMVEVVEVGSAAGLVVELVDTVLFSNTDQTTMVTLSVAAVISDIFVYVATGFDDSGTDLLDIGITGTGNRYEDNLDISGTGFKTMTLTNIRDWMGANTNITFEYFPQNTDATVGEAYIYVRYAIH